MITPLGLTEVIEDEWQEKEGSVYLYWALHPMFVLGLDYFYENYEHDEWEGTLGIKKLTTHRLTPKVNFYHPCGFSAKLSASYQDQEGDFGSHLLGFEHDGDQFWIVDASISYRLPKRLGILTLEMRNLFDEQFQFLDTDPSNPRIIPERQIIGRLTVTF